MEIADLDDVRIHWRQDGNPQGRPVVFANSLGTDFRLWDKVIPLLPQNLRLIRWDKRGHGLSSCPKPPYGMGALVHDAERLLDYLNVRDCVFVGLSIGGMIAQGLAVKRLDQVRAMVLSNTGAKIGTAGLWQERIDTLRQHGIPAIADQILQRWFDREFRQSAEFEGWKNMLIRTPLDGYLGCASAIAGTDFYTPTAGLRLPTLGIAGSEDGSTPPDLVRETVDLIPGSKFEIIRRAGHLPCVEAPERYAEILTDFFKENGHV